MPAKTNLDLHLSASEAAQKALAYSSDFEVATGSLESFKADNNDPRDWDVWKQSFDERLSHFKMLSGQPSPSSLADKKAAQAAALKPAS